MLPFEDRYSRQRRLPEVGTAGQRRLEQGSLVLAAHPGADLERDYLVRAGVGGVSVDHASGAAAFPWADEFEVDVCRDIARGAWSALAHLRQLLELSMETTGSSARGSAQRPAPP